MSNLPFPLSPIAPFANLSTAQKAQAREDLGFSGNVLMVPGDYATPDSALDAASEGDTVLVGVGTFASPTSGWKDGITLLGSGEPTANAARTALSGGTIFTGFMDLGSTGYRGITLANFGVISATDGISTTGAAGAWPDFIARNITVLCTGGGSSPHGFSFEQLLDARLENLTAIKGVHGMALKSRFVDVTGFRCEGNSGDGLIITASSATMLAQHINVRGMVARDCTGVGLRISDAATGQTRHINADNLVFDGCARDIELLLNNSTNAMAAINIGNVVGSGGVAITSGGAGDFDEVTFTNVIQQGAAVAFALSRPGRARFLQCAARYCTTGWQLEGSHDYSEMILAQCSAPGTTTGFYNLSGTPYRLNSTSLTNATLAGNAATTRGTTLFSNVAGTVIVNTVTETPLNADGYSGNTSVSAADFAKYPGIRWIAAGALGTSGTPALIFTVYLDGTALATTGAVTLPNSVSGVAWKFEGDIEFQTVASTGYGRVTGRFIFANGATMNIAPAYAAFTGFGDLTTERDFTITAQWGAAHADNILRVDTFRAELIQGPQ